MTMKKGGRYIDLSMILLITGIFIIANYFSIAAKDEFFQDELMLVALIGIIIVIYFYGMTAGIILSTIIIFTFGSYVIYNSIILGREVNLSVYFWIAAVIYTCAASIIFYKGINYLETNYKKMRQEYEQFVTIDSVTKLDNIKAFYNELSQCMSMSDRYKLPLCLMIIKINHFDQMEKLIGYNNMSQLLKNIGQNIIKSSRHEDKLFSLESRDTFALIMWTNKLSAEVVKDRIKENINNINLKTFSKGVNVIIDFKLGVSEYSGKGQNIMELVNLAEKELEYDV